MSPQIKKMLSSMVVLILAAFAYIGTSPRAPSVAPPPTQGHQAPQNPIAPSQREWKGPIVLVGSLPVQAVDVLSLIERGGPFRYSKDGTEFQNRERILPLKNRGYYREFTVTTPGENDRGARRIITGEQGEKYYTDDHYDSFQLIQ